ncbi:lipoteichoic acid synthase 2 [Clostridium pasteurianum DSM 525 = ATCC 6013]|uniref:Lipoteichoic acid synthase 2 n=1 Tax=Clostridium pasteurianum DSM 525 = ATCC 6013 TaxID=1262449 RepID=A0A0H3J4D1_CLOPA|nr:LTA synthase family protein [Clostridium pasteurianum]AJA48334.1 lipoteichoic acid synthase 2 [Clostridium pasteurianum DSM 525 = ATCC 6013]AJA52322.1 lipoteichoic acid synthase 2 [Clostridium pasteurianum DSM 525 = ATCC 6013]AOZ75583.1 alkaline phosphatase [Clostridium pasteurianum DSM 525 = ATCC 6013]AOZ79379.1 alkaline phosphatase [Clostridium pasteurianum]ELP60517.1 Alkaline phosphatase superfamily protein [Clostridium pasteurianum DSM 525 = ATCC 6013]
MYIDNNTTKLTKSEKIKQFFIKNLDIIYFIVILSIKSFNFNKFISPVYFNYFYIGAATISAVGVFASIALLFKNNTRTRLLYIFNIVLSVLIIVDTVYYRYFKDLMSLGVVRNGFLLGGVGASVKELIKPTDFLYLLDIFILIPFLRFYKKVPRIQLKFIKRFAIFLIVFAIFVAVDAKKIHDLDKEQPRLISTMFNRLYLAQVLGPINFHILDTYNVTSTAVSNMQKLPEERQNEIKTYLENKNSNTTTTANLKGAGNGKNLIVIQVEALQEFVINKKLDGQEITPNLNRWINKSLYFNNYFYQVAAGNTSDAEFLSNNSLYPAASGAAYYMYSGDTLNSMAKEFKEKDYYTAALHGYREGFWNRNVMYKSEKFDDFYGQRAYNINENVGLGLSDKSFLNQSFDKIKSFSQPFFAFTITLSSHYPYDDVNGYDKGTTNKFNSGKYENTLLGDYLKGIHYTDEQLGMFLDKLESSGMMDNSIVVLYGDHYAIPKNSMPLLYDFEGIKNPTDLDWFELQKVPMLIHFPKDEHKGINSLYTGQIDLFPTIANLYNLSNKYMLGKDMLNSSTGDVNFRSGSFTDGNAFYVSWTNTYYDVKTKKVIPSTPALEAKKETTLTELQYSDDILNHNLLKKFLQEDSENKSNK